MSDGKQKTGGVRLFVLIGLSMAVLVAVTAGAFGLLVAGYTEIYLDESAETTLDRALEDLEQRVTEKKSAIEQSLGTVRDLLQDNDYRALPKTLVQELRAQQANSGIASAGKPFEESLELLRSVWSQYPDVSAAWYVDADGTSLHLQRHPDSGLSVSTTGIDGSNPQRTQGDTGSLKFTAEQPGEDHDLRESIWYQEAIRRMRGRSDDNQRALPDVGWTLSKTNNLTAAVAFRERGGSNTVVVALEIDAADWIRTRAQATEPDLIMVVDSGSAVNHTVSDSASPSDILMQGHTRWRGDPELRMAVFSTPNDAWRIRFTQLSLTPDCALHFGAAIRTDALLQNTRSLRDGVVVSGLAMLLLALLITFLLTAAIKRPIRVFVSQAIKLEPFRGGTTTWPATRIREMRELRTAFDLLSQEARDLQLITLEPSAPAVTKVPAPEAERVAEAEAEPTVVAEPPAVVAPDKPVETTEAPPAQEVAAGPSPMFMQALQSARRGLRAAREENEALVADASRIEATLAAREESLAHLAQTFDALRYELDTTAQLQQIAEVLGLSHVGLWQLDAEGERLEYQQGSDAPNGRAVVNHDTAPLFIATLRGEDHIAISDVNGDPRASGFPTKATALFCCCGPTDETFLIAEHADGPRRWQPEETMFLLAVSALLESESTEIPVPDSLADDGLQEFERAFSAMESNPFPDSEGERYRWLIESAEMVFFATDAKGRVNYANPSAERALDGVAEHWLGRPLHDCVPGDAAAIDAALRDATAGGTARVVEGSRGSGGGRWRFAIAPLCDEDGEVNGTTVCGVMLPPAEAVDPQPVAAPSQAARIAALPGGVLWSVDTIGCLTYVAPAVTALYGYSAQDLKGRPLTALSGEDQGQRDLAQLSQLMEGAPCRGYHAQHRSKDGELIDVLVYGAVLTDAEGQVQGAAGVVVPVPGDRDND